ncbi:Serine/threonine-protein phosphatase 2A 55 kDa regulatory subunit B [Aphelenchoides besseyi]|nr:Serine/threonine-protein phosphatase 2A 55 kDa regulatory subunit B [Aphelenchoides besseyi]KAI6210839.1 Serine/threonine-protein phosphatase 2A 55 kDa regulatory subunit B [Aphelenchoides besseyi]
MEYDRDPSGQEDNAMDVDNNDMIVWRCIQREPNNGASDDTTEAEISTVEFSEDGEMLAIGDKMGRISILKRDHDYNSDGARSSQYAVYSTFQSHEPEFDYLKSLEIEEKINQVKWMKKKSSSDFILSTNDKTIKLWKISERQRQIAQGNYNIEEVDGVKRRINNGLVLPKLEPMELLVEASPRRVYSNAHVYHINSISINSDQETFISADDLRINLWNHEITNQCFTIVDIKPVNMEELTEVITTAEFHPTAEQLFCYGSSKGLSKICDTRENALCDRPAKVFHARDDARNFFSELIASVSDIKFSHSGRYLLTRDYLSAYVWDLAMETQPVEVYNVHDYLRNKLCQLYENDCIFDKFQAQWSGDDDHILTGSYNNFFRTFRRSNSWDTTYEAIEPFYARRAGPAGDATVNERRRPNEINVDRMDFDRKILHSSWNPNSNVISLSSGSYLYIFEGEKA